MMEIPKGRDAGLLAGVASNDQTDPFYGDSARKAGGPGWLGFGRSRGHSLGAMDDAFAYQGDVPGFHQWARENGWLTPSEQPPVIAEILQGAPVPTGPEYAVTDLVTGAFQGWDILAFNVGMKSSRGVVPKWAMTAIGRAEEGDAFWLHPQRLGAFRLGSRDGRVVAIVNPQLGDRWVLRVNGSDDISDSSVINPRVEQALLSSDDGDELWATATAIAAVRADGHRPALLEHHLQLLASLAEADAERRPSR